MPFLSLCLFVFLNIGPLLWFKNCEAWLSCRGCYFHGCNKCRLEIQQAWTQSAYMCYNEWQVKSSTWNKIKNSDPVLTWQVRFLIRGDEQQETNAEPRIPHPYARSGPRLHGPAPADRPPSRPRQRRNTAICCFTTAPNKSRYCQHGDDRRCWTQPCSSPWWMMDAELNWSIMDKAHPPTSRL